MADHFSEFMLSSVRPLFRAIATTIVPESAEMTERDWLEAEAIIDRALRDRPPQLQRQLLLYIKLLNLLPLLRFGRRFMELNETQRMRTLQAIQRAPVLAIRRGLWGVRTLVYMGYYARPSAASGIGYRATALGWDARQ